MSHQIITSIINFLKENIKKYLLDKNFNLQSYVFNLFVFIYLLCLTTIIMM